MRPTFVAALAAGLVMVLAASGCRTTVNTVENTERQGVRQMVNDSRVITDRTLNRKVNVVGVNATTAPNGVMRVQIEVVNLKSSPQTFFSSFEWFDANAMQVSSASGGWTQRQIMGRESMMLQATAPTPECRDFRLKLMENPR